MIVKLLFAFFCFFAALKRNAQDRKAFPTALKHGAQNRNCAAGFDLRKGTPWPLLLSFEAGQCKINHFGQGGDKGISLKVLLVTSFQAQLNSMEAKIPAHLDVLL